LECSPPKKIKTENEKAGGPGKALGPRPIYYYLSSTHWDNDLIENISGLVTKKYGPVILDLIDDSKCGWLWDNLGPFGDWDMIFSGWLER
jgi:hypothetical protein